MDNLIEFFYVKLQNSANAHMSVDKPCMHLKIYSEPLLNFPLAADNIIHLIVFLFSSLEN